MNARRFVAGCIAIAMIMPCLARTGDASQAAPLARLDTCVQGVGPSALALVDTVIFRSLSSTGGNLNTTTRGACIIIR